MDYNSGYGTGAGVVVWLFYVAIIVFSILVQWKLFTKAGKPGWASIIPIYSILCYWRLSENPGGIYC